jgi:hypothetical protein
VTKQRYSSAELDARLKFVLGTILGLILLFTALGILYALIFVTQPVNAQSENDKMFFNVLGSIATFITGTLAGILIGSKGGDAPKSVFDEEANIPFVMDDAAPAAAATADEAKAAAEATPAAEPVVEGKPNSQMPDEQPIDENWDKED